MFPPVLHPSKAHKDIVRDFLGIQKKVASFHLRLYIVLFSARLTLKKDTKGAYLCNRGIRMVEIPHTIVQPKFDLEI